MPHASIKYTACKCITIKEWFFKKYISVLTLRQKATAQGWDQSFRPVKEIGKLLIHIKDNVREKDTDENKEMTEEMEMS